MQSNSPFFTPPPIPTPDGNFARTEKSHTLKNKSDWLKAPVVVRAAAYPLTWVGMILFALGTFGGIFGIVDSGNRPNVQYRATDFRIGLIITAVCLTLLITHIWLNRCFKKGAFAAWNAQIILSVLIVLGLLLGIMRGNNNPLSWSFGIAIYICILSQWFKPETKAWFGKS